MDPAHQEHARTVAHDVIAWLKENPLVCPGWLNTEQAAQYIGSTPKTLVAWRARRQGPKYSRRGNTWVRYRIADLDAFMEESYVERD